MVNHEISGGSGRPAPGAAARHHPPASAPPQMRRGVIREAQHLRQQPTVSRLGVQELEQRNLIWVSMNFPLGLPPHGVGAVHRRKRPGAPWERVANFVCSTHLSYRRRSGRAVCSRRVGDSALGAAAPHTSAGDSTSCVMFHSLAMRSTTSSGSTRGRPP